MKKIKLLLTLAITSFIALVKAQQPSYVIADFRAVNTQGCSPFIVLLFDSSRSDQTIVARRWVITDASGDTVFVDNTNKTTVGVTLSDSGCYTVSLFAVNRLQVSDFRIRQNYLCVKAKPRISFTASVMGGCPPLTVNFQCNSQALCGIIDSVTVDFKNGIVQSFPACSGFSTTYTNTGQYRPTFFVKNSCGCFSDSTWTNPITVANKPVASFTAAGNTQSCSAPYAVQFTAQSQGPNVLYQWFVNGTVRQNSTSQFFNFNFGVGKHNVMLVVIDTLTRCSDTLNRLNYIVVGQPATPSFIANRTSGCGSLNVRLRNQTQGSPTNLRWRIIDNQNNLVYQQSGPVSQMDSISTSINNPGTYTVCLIATFQGGCSDSFCIPNYLTVHAHPNSDFNVNRTQFCTTPASVTATPVVNCGSCTYSWSTTGLPNTSGATFNPTYTTPGNKNISVTVTDANGCTSTTTKNNIVRINNLTARIFKTGRGGCPPYTVSFADSTQSPETITNVSWSFPGGSITSFTGSTPPPVTYSAAGVYVVTLQVQTVSGCTATVRDTIRVSNKPTGTFTVNPTTVCYEEIPNLFRWMGSSFDTLIWHFGDGGTATRRVDTISYFYRDLGDYTPCVIASKDGCRSDSICMNQITVNGPIANFTDSFHCSNRKNYFYKNTSVQATSYFWRFCDGTTTTQMNPQKYYPNCDTCTVTLTAFNSLTGCTHRKSLVTNVICPQVDFVVSDTVGCINFRPTFTNISSNKASTRWDFNINNGIQYSSGQHSMPAFNNTYLTPGYYGVSMVNIDANGCRDTVTKPNLIKVTRAVASMRPSDTVFCIPHTVNFTNNSSAVLSSVTRTVWNYGNGTPPDSSYHGSHQYTTMGIFRVRLTVFNEYGCFDTVSRNILANKITAAALFDDSTCVGATNLFVNQSTGINQVYQWSFPGGTPANSTSRNISVVYNSQGSFPVRLIVRDNTNTCRDTLRDTIHVYNPIANYGLDKKYASCPNPPFLVQFFDSSRNDIHSWEWDFGDGTPISNERNPTHYYTHAGVFPVRLTVRTNNGCESTIIKDTVVVDGPFATMTFSPQPGICPCDSVEFTITTVKATQAILLDGQNPPYTFPSISPVGTFDNPTVLKRKVRFCTSGTANAQALVSDGMGCNVLLQPVPVLIDTPSTDFTFINNVCDSGSVCFTDNSMFFTPGTYFASRLWEFGDGETDTTANPCHFFKSPGNYSVKLTVYNNLGCSMSKIKVVRIKASPRINILANDTNGCAGQTITFTHQTITDSPTIINTISWNLGNGNTSSLSSPSQNYPNPGTYNVELTVTDNLGCVGRAMLPVTINPLPQANGEGDTTICAGSTALLRGTGGSTCLWTPSRGLNDSSSCTPLASPATDQWYFFTAIDTNGCMGKDSVLVKVANLKASFNRASVCFPDTVSIRYTGSNTNGTIVSYLYDLGDGNTSTLRNPKHVYASAGTYNVKLLITDNNGCTDDTINTVKVRPKPHAIASADTACAGNPTTLTDLSVSGSDSSLARVWEVGAAGQLRYDSVATFIYPSSGSYIVKLSVTNDGGCKDDTTIRIWVRPNPKADFTAPEVCKGRATQFTPIVQTNNVIKSMIWDFDMINTGRATSQIAGPVQHIYDSAGNYAVMLKVSDMFGCSHDTIKIVSVWSLPKAMFEVQNNCTNAAVQFTSVSKKGSANIASYNWTFGTGTPSAATAVNPIVQAGNVSGTYPVRLIVTDTNGCSDTLQSTFRLFEGPTAKMFVYDSTVCLNNCVQLSNISTPGENPIKRVEWDMNADGSTEFVNQNIQCYQFNNPGYKNIKLTVYDSIGCKNSVTVPVQILSVPKADFEWRPV
ncbi:MAG: PKD domain-containing protein [Chitinophagales bacterium]|nr:PKD domain-containing protein [Chitinophagales bacterium]